MKAGNFQPEICSSSHPITNWRRRRRYAILTLPNSRASTGSVGRDQLPSLLVASRKQKPGWRNWQTQRTQNPPTFGSWGFDSPSRHQQQPPQNEQLDGGHFSPDNGS